MANSLKADLQAIKKHSSTHDVYNRLHSIARDMRFVEEVRGWFEGRFPVIANQRCGLWYTNPETSSSEYAYFKSTDGHTSQWDFPLRRANLHLVDVIRREGGVILVDSTRRGKRMPDALSKTIPIWCTVINRAIARRDHKPPEEWDLNLYTPPQIVSPTEKAQIKVLLDGWVDKLLSSALTLPTLPKPLRPIFIHPSTTSPPSLPASLPFLPVVLTCASVFVGQDGPEYMRDTWGGYEYVQGGGDDEEMWGRGLDSRVFHQHRKPLLQAPKESLPTLIDCLLLSTPSAPTLRNATLATPTQIPNPTSHLWLGLIGAPLPPVELSSITLTTSRGAVEVETEREITLVVPEGKKGQVVFLTKVLPAAVRFARAALAAGRDVIVLDSDGKDLGIGVIVVLLWFCYSDDGTPRSSDSREDEAGIEGVGRPNKEQIQTRLQWVLDKRPGGNPARGTLKRVNEFLMSPVRR